MATPPVQVEQQDVPAALDTSNGDIVVAKVAPAPDVTEAFEPGMAVLNESAPAQQRAESPPDKVVDYLWSVYQRSPLKRDGHGEFTWKDVSAAERLGLSLRDYVIGGMDPDFREQLYHAGLAMDAAGIEWTILSGFRDDYRQTIASGLKARPGNSFHGGSVATGGYAHGCAVDIASVDRPRTSRSGDGLMCTAPSLDCSARWRGSIPPTSSRWGRGMSLRRGSGPRAACRTRSLQPSAASETPVPVAASSGETAAEPRADCTKPRLAVADNKEAEPAPAPAKWGRVLSLPEPRATAAQAHLESRWSRSHGKWHLQVTAAKRLGRTVSRPRGRLRYMTNR